MKTASDIKAILKDVFFPGYLFEVIESDRLYLQASFCAPCANTGAMTLQYTRKWYVSGEATRSEVVQTALKCVLTSVEHEARENFKYRGRPIFGPHFDVDKLYAIAAHEELDIRASGVGLQRAIPFANATGTPCSAGVEEGESVDERARGELPR